MSQDLLLQPDRDGLYDLRLTGNDFSAVDGMETAILVSLFSDARAPASRVTDPLRRRGWIGDILTAGIGRKLGSLLWLYEQSRLTETVKNSIVTEAENCLRWMVEDGVAQAVSVSILEETLRSLSLLISITAPNGTINSYVVLWRSTMASNFERIQ